MGRSVDPQIDEAQVIITFTTSKVAIYNQAGVAEKLLISVGAFTSETLEIGKKTSWTVVFTWMIRRVRDRKPRNLIQVGIDWDKVCTFCYRVGEARYFPRPIVFKSVGTGAWDLAACRVARKALGL